MTTLSKKFFVSGILLGIASLIVTIFWFQEIQYLRPTPVPFNYSEVPVGTHVEIDFLEVNDKSKFFHFYSSDCPCSKFNLKNYESLVNQYNQEFDMYFVSNESRQNLSSDLEDLLNKHGVYFIHSEDQELAQKLGVYSTPQIALLDANHKLFYRGNYNKARYCTSKVTDYAGIAIDSLNQGGLNPSFNKYATTSYGCSLNK